VEPGAFSAQWRAALEARGHELQPARRMWGNMQAVFKSKRDGRAIATSDPRGADY
jgi:gamma-glutamyltranspeptidase/glutathione hydrolase